jgi:hypothetical protein
MRHPVAFTGTDLSSLNKIVARAYHIEDGIFSQHRREVA